ncbi:MAG: bifunctional (p)ppGpp synthetase/guanosine-3',5'-bis(diphosphate) 3'-pyrophosphohydrolase [Clostridiales bacterium]|nr:bifunctional (p)ppGpp synthetase/guanosine-3',5'-bis(diphosphate) 3'-pyrophosphohydrolase [Clostridiales bacterium]
MDKDKFLDHLKKANPDLDFYLIGKAYDLGEKAHEGQFRKSGEAYFVHPVEVAKILADLDMDSQTIAAALMHDVVEDTEYTYEDIEQYFGEDIALLVDGVTKLGSLKFDNKEERQAENLRKMFLAMTKDIRVLIIKLADRLHNMRTINFMTDAKIVEKCRETLDIYAPLADRLGISKIKFELEDLALKSLEPELYYSLVSGVRMKKYTQDDYIEKVIVELKQALSELNIEYEIYGRYKHYYSIYKKMNKGKTLDEIFDLAAIRIIVDSVKDCYSILGVVHTLWKPIPGRFKDYIAMPKPNMYQSIHTTLIGNYGAPFEVQIRTKEMHRVAEYGIAAHWKYKEGINENHEDTEKKLAWLRQTIELQKDMNDPGEFMESLKVDLFSNQVFVFTPKGTVVELPAGSTPLDFAFKIHSEVGIKCVGAKVNGKMVPLNHVLENGNLVEIITNPNSKGPSSDWLSIVKSTQAKNKIRQWFRKENRAENIEKGRTAIEKAVKRKAYDSKLLLKQPYLLKVAKSYKFPSIEELYVAVGYGGVPSTKVANMLVDMLREEENEELKREQQEITVAEFEKSNQLEEEEKRRHTKKDATGVNVKGVDGLMIKFAKCCTPVPGDEIVGYITKGRGISVHRKDCANMMSLPEDEKGRFIDVEWDADALNKHSFEADIFVLAEDRKRLIMDISIAVQEMDVNVRSMNVKTTKDKKAMFNMTLDITEPDQIRKVLLKIKNVDGIIDAYRATT